MVRRLDRNQPRSESLEYDSLIRVLATLPHRDLQWYVDALPFPSLLDYSID